MVPVARRASSLATAAEILAMNQSALRRIVGTSALRVALMAFCVCAGLLYVRAWPAAPIMSLDSPEYMRVAQKLPSGSTAEPSLRTPGYPWLLFLAGAEREPTRRLFCIQLGMHFACVLLLAAELNACGVRPVATAVFAAIASLPVFVEPTAMVLTESLAELAVTLSAVALARAVATNSLPDAVASGLALALAALTRPTFQLLFVVAATIPWCLPGAPVGRRARVSVVVVVVAVSLLAPTIVRNRSRFGFTGLTPLLGFSLSTKTAPFVERLSDEYALERKTLVSYRNEALVTSEGQHTAEMYIWAAAPELRKLTGLGTVGLADRLLKLNIQLIAQNPQAYLLEVARVASRYWFPNRTELELASFGSKRWAVAWELVQYLVSASFLVVVVAGAGVCLAAQVLPRAERRRLATRLARDLRGMGSLVILASFALYTWLISVTIEAGVARYRIPTNLAILAALVLGVRVASQLRGGLALGYERPPELLTT